VGDSDENNEDTDADEFVDAGDDVDDGADHASWVTERRHSGDGEVSVYVGLFITFAHRWCSSFSQL